MISPAVQIVGMKATRDRQKAKAGSATSMNGRRRPIGVWKVSLQGPITRGTLSAKSPSAAMIAAMTVAELVKRSRYLGR